MFNNPVVMKTKSWKLYPLPLLLALMALSISPSRAETGYDEELILERLEQIENPLFDLQYNNIVRGYLKGYLQRNRRSAELIVGRSVLYFPIMEDYLEQWDMPDKLKYLPVVESALNPHAISPVGASGLWQFMPGTATDHGLKINDYIDERLDPHKSTEAALGYLKREYEKYGSWALALAAYNGGSGRVSRAIKRGRSKNFWRIRRYMPRETRNYVPAYIAATYLMEYHQDHNIEPAYPGLELQITEAIKLYDVISFYRIAQLTGLRVDVIKALNPAYKRDLIPADTRGNYLILPKRVMPAIRDYLEAKRPDHLADHFFRDEMVEALPAGNENYSHSLYFVQEGEQLADIAGRLKCSVHQLQAWNPGRTDSIYAGLELTVYFPKQLRRFQPMKPMKNLSTLPALPLPEATSPLHPLESRWPRRIVAYHAINEKQRLQEFSIRRPQYFLPDLLELNELEPEDKLRPGDMIKVYYPQPMRAIRR